MHLKQNYIKKKKNLPEHQQDSHSDPFTVLVHISFLSTYLLYTIFEYAFSLHVVLKFYF